MSLVPGQVRTKELTLNYGKYPFIMTDFTLGNKIRDFICNDFSKRVTG